MKSESAYVVCIVCSPNGAIKRLLVALHHREPSVADGRHRHIFESVALKLFTPVGVLSEVFIFWISSVIFFLLLTIAFSFIGL